MVNSTELQRKIFSRWCNQKLFLSRGIEITDCVTDFSTGINLIKLLEVLSESDFPEKYDQKPKMRVQNIDNCNRALKWCWSLGVQMKIKPQAEDLVDGRERSVLGLVWSIMLKFMKFGDDEEEQLSAKDALLMWVQNKTAAYSNVNIQDFKKSFANGLALCALIHKQRPNLVDYDSLAPENALANIKVAQEGAGAYFGLEQYLTPEEFLILDDNSTFVYVSEFFYGFAEMRKVDLAARRIAKLIRQTKENDAMKAEYNATAAKNKETMARAAELLGDRTIDNTMAGAKKRLEDFYTYKATDKSSIIADQLALEGLFNNLSMRLSFMKRPPFQPAQGCTLADVDQSVKALEEAEQERKVALHAELNRQVRLLRQDGTHKNKSANLDAWFRSKLTYLNTKEVSDTVGDAFYQLKRLDGHEKEVASVKESNFVDLKALGAILVSEKYERSDQVLSRENTATETFEKLATGAAAKRPVLEDDLAREKFRAKLVRMSGVHRYSHEKLAAWVEEKSAYLQTKEVVDCISAAEMQLGLLEAYESEKVTMTSTSVAGLKELGADIRSQKYETQYSSASCENVEELLGREADIDNKWNTLSELSAQKKAVLEADLAREQKKEELRLEYADQASAFIRWVESTAENLAASEFGFTLEEVEAYQTAMDEEDANLKSEGNSKKDAAVAVFQAAADLGVTENRYAQYSVSELDSGLAKLNSSLQARNDAYAAELALQRANDALCKNFAELAEPFSKSLISNKDHITHNQDELEDQKSFVDSKIASLDADGAPLASINELQAEIDAKEITNNRHTTLTAKDCSVQFEQYQDFLSKKLKMLEEAIENAKLRGITPEEFQEIEDNFTQYDTDADGKINRKEVRACLYSLGEETTTKRLNAIMEEYGPDGTVNKESFKSFMITVLGDAEGKEEILDGFKLICRGEERVAAEEKLAKVLKEHDVSYIKETAPAADSGYDYVAWTEDVFSR